MWDHITHKEDIGQPSFNCQGWSPRTREILNKLLVQWSHSRHKFVSTLLSGIQVSAELSSKCLGDESSSCPWSCQWIWETGLRATEYTNTQRCRGTFLSRLKRDEMKITGWKSPRSTVTVSRDFHYNQWFDRMSMYLSFYTSIRPFTEIT